MLKQKRKCVKNAKITKKYPKIQSKNGISNIFLCTKIAFLHFKKNYITDTENPHVNFRVVQKTFREIASNRLGDLRCLFYAQHVRGKKIGI